MTGVQFNAVSCSNFLAKSVGLARTVPGNTAFSPAVYQLGVRRWKLETELPYPSNVDIHICIKFPANNDGVMLGK
jgi:hypothetical protein